MGMPAHLGFGVLGNSGGKAEKPGYLLLCSQSIPQTGTRLKVFSKKQTPGMKPIEINLQDAFEFGGFMCVRPMDYPCVTSMAPQIGLLLPNS